jgi:hypothetical protein
MRDLTPAPVLDAAWRLHLDLLGVRVLVWFVSLGQDADLTPDAHLFFFDRYQRLALVYRRHKNLVAAARYQQKADWHYRGAGLTDPPRAAAMAMPRPRRWISTNAMAQPSRDDTNPAA